MNAGRQVCALTFTLPVPNAKHPRTSDIAAAAEEDSANRTELEIPFRTFVKIVVFLLALVALYKLWPLIAVLIMAILVAGALKPAEEKLGKHMPRWAARVSLVGIFILGFVGLLSLLIPSLAGQVMELGKNIPNLKDSMLKHLPGDKIVQQSANDLLSSLTPERIEPVLQPLLSTGTMLLGGVGQFLLVIVFAFYIVADEGGLMEWFLAYFRPDTRSKCKETIDGLQDVIFSYVTGQAIISLCVLVFTFTALTLLGVPGAPMLALLAAVMDVLPVLGFIISGVPAVLLALSVSLPVALTVLALYVTYHGVENYLLVPRIYGKSLRISALGVLLGFFTGMLLAGVPGAIAALPIVAAYPLIERVWLADYLGQRVIRKHEAQKEEEFGKEE